MPTTRRISQDRIGELLTCIFASGDPVVKEAYSEFDRATRTFTTPQSLLEHIVLGHKQGRKLFHYAIHHPESKGFVLEKRIELKPGAVKNHTHRFSQEGWGLILLQITLKGRLTSNAEWRSIPRPGPMIGMRHLIG